MIEQLYAGIDGWDFIAGLGLFLLGMMQTENGLKELAGSRIRRFLRNHTDHPLKAIGSGIAATALLQSSSLVSLLVLAMVGARIIALRNALGVVIGANLGTTMTGWIVASIGFKLNLGSIALPAIALGSIGLVALGDVRRIAPWARLIVGLGLILFGLDFMKQAVATDGLVLDTTGRPWLFLGLGIVVTAIIQSSSAAMMIALAAVHAGSVSLENAAAFVIGADLGTTSTVLLGMLGASADRKRVGLAHFLFNLVVDAVAFLVLLPLLPLVISAAGEPDPVYTLVAFHTCFNFLGIAVFLPVLPAFTRFLSGFFVESQVGIARSLKAAVAADAESALEAMLQETDHLSEHVRKFTVTVLAPDGAGMESDSAMGDYLTIKTLESEILQFGMKLQRSSLNLEQSQRLESILASARDLVHCAKSIKDSSKDMATIKDSSSEQDRALHVAIVDAYSPVLEQSRRPRDPVSFESFAKMDAQIQRTHSAIHEKVYAGLSEGQLAWPDASSLLNANRELFIAANDFTNALARLSLSPDQFDDLESIPRVAV